MSFFAKWVAADGRFLFALENNGGVEISDEEKEALFAGHETGKIIQPDVDGYPVLVDPPVEPVILSCSAYQIREALNITGLRDQVEAAIAAGSRSLNDAWQYEQRFKRDNQRIIEMGTSLGLNNAQIDALFELAVTLVP